MDEKTLERLMEVIKNNEILLSNVGAFNDGCKASEEYAEHIAIWVINSAESFCNSYDFEQRLNDCEKYSFLSVDDLRKYVNEIQDIGRVSKSFIAILKDCGYYSNNKNFIDDIEKSIDDGIAWCIK